MRPPLRCDWSNCGRDRQSHLYGRHCTEHTCEECWNGRIAGCMYCADHKCTWPGPKGCQSYKDDEDTYCTDHARVDWSCQWSDSTCPSPRIIDFEIESGYCFARHKCSISDCPWRIKRGGRYCAEDHACIQPDCVKEATASGCCEACQCPWPGCRYPKTEESGLCAHHDCPCGNELKRSDEKSVLYASGKRIVPIQIVGMERDLCAAWNTNAKTKTARKWWILMLREAYIASCTGVLMRIVGALGRTIQTVQTSKCSSANCTAARPRIAQGGARTTRVCRSRDAVL